MLHKLFSIDLLGCCASIILGASGAYAAGLGVSKEAFGKMSNATPVDKYTLTNTHGASF
jgi:hypothetical protein